MAIFRTLASIILLLGLVWFGENNQSLAATVTPLKFRGICYSPFRDGQAPGGIEPSTGQVNVDLVRLKKHTRNIRTYSCDGIQGAIPSRARAMGLTVVAGIWLSGNEADDILEIQRGVQVTNRNANVCAVTVGSEVLLRGSVTKAKLIEYINLVKSQVKVPVGTAEVYGKWLENSDLVAAADFLMINVFAYWEGVAVNEAAAFTMSKYDAVAAAYPGKPVILGEVGWPAAGETVGQAVPGEAQQAQFLRGFVQLAVERDVAYFLFAAFDEVWKTVETGLEVESHWGLFDSQRQLKPAVADLIAAPPPMIDLRGVGECGAINMAKKLVKGYAYGVDPSAYRIVVYARTNAWYVQPFANKPYTRFNLTGYFKSRTHLGDQYAALLVTKEFVPPPVVYGSDLFPSDENVVGVLFEARRGCGDLPPPVSRLLAGR